MADKIIWNTTETAKALSLTMKGVHDLVHKGVIKKTGRGQFDAIESSRGYIEYLRKQAEPKGLAAARVSSEEARKELWYQQARKAKVAADIAERSVVEIDQVRADMTELLQTIATTIKASSMAPKQINDLFEVIREGGTAFDVKYGWRS
jgi:predicted site-specific integrase-resolvase